MVVVANKAMFGGGPYSVAGGAQARYVGRQKRVLAEIRIAKRNRRKGKKIGRYFRPGMIEPFMPKTFSDEFHPGGNSVCYLIQTAHLMGCDPIYLLGFTMEAGSPYEFGKVNPVTRRSSFWDIEPPMDWLRFYESRYPGRVRVCSGWSGPIYDVFKLERFDDRHSDTSEPS